MPKWSPVAILPNLFAKESADGEVISLAPSHDARVQAICGDIPKFKLLLSRFTDAFHVPLEPVVLIVRNDLISRLDAPDALLSFRAPCAPSHMPAR